jgi:hypothetical protein
MMYADEATTANYSFLDVSTSGMLHWPCKKTLQVRRDTGGNWLSEQMIPMAELRKIAIGAVQCPDWVKPGR